MNECLFFMNEMNSIEIEIEIELKSVCGGDDHVFWCVHRIPNQNTE